jgi:hypothetical protein
MIGRTQPIFTGHFHFQDNVEIPAHVWILVCWHALVAEDDCHSRGNDLAFGARYSHPSTVKVVDQYTIKAQKRLG